MNITRTLVAGRTHWAPVLRLVYLNNAKVACSTIKKSLWRAVDKKLGTRTYVESPHDRPRAPFSKNLRDLKRNDDYAEFLEATFFSVVRNPYVRILSSYLNKVRSGRGSGRFWRKFTLHFDLPATAQLSFLEFLELISREEPTRLDWHLCPQAVNLLYPIAPLDFIGHLERFDLGTTRFLLDQGISIQSHRPHKTDAGERIMEFYGRRERRIVLRYYEKDFELFGYSEDPMSIMPVRPAVRNGSRSRLHECLFGTQ